MKNKIKLFFSVLFVFLLLQTFAFALPRRASNYVNDYAGIINSQVENKINRLLSSLEKQTTAEVAVVTVRSLDGYSIEDYAVRLFEVWGIGKRDKDNGVLFLIAPKQRKLRIEVGYGLEGALPDGLVGAIRDQYILPYFKQADYNKGILNGVEALVSYIAKEYNISNLVLDDYSVNDKTVAKKNSLLANFIYLIFVILLMQTRFWPILFFMGGGRSGYYSRGGGGFGSGFGGFGGGLSGGGGASGSW